MRIINKKYPKRFLNPELIEIAVSQIQHDLRKLFPSISESDWPKIDRDVKEWFLGEKFELEPIHDFWNIFGSFARDLRQKSLLFWVTAENVIWSEEEVRIDDIEITWDFPGLEFMGKAPYRASDVRKKLNENKNTKINLMKNSEYRSGKYMPRDHYRIVLFYDQKGGIINKRPGYYILEGNRRVVRAIVNDFETIPAFVGRFKNKNEIWPTEFWFQTGILRDIIFLAIGYEKKGDKEAFGLCRKFYQLLLRDFDIARIATIDKSFKNFERSEKLILDIILEDLK